MIDAHHHLWDPGARTYEWLMGGQVWATEDELARLRRPFTRSELEPLAARAGVTGTVVIQTVNATWETRDLMALAAGLDPYGPAFLPRTDATGLLGGVVGWVDVAAPDLDDHLDQLASEPGGTLLCGIRHPLLGEADPDWLIRPAVLRGLRRLGERGLCFDIVTLPQHVGAVVTAAETLPEVCLVLDHMCAPPVEAGGGGAWGDWKDAIGQLGALPNVVCKLSGMHTSSVDPDALRPAYSTVLDAFGPDRLMFGSDWPVSSLSATYGDVCGMYQELTADLSHAERDAIFERTARRVYGLDARAR